MHIKVLCKLESDPDGISMLFRKSLKKSYLFYSKSIFLYLSHPGFHEKINILIELISYIIVCNETAYVLFI